MSSPTTQQFAFVTCQPGAEQPLKAEVAALHTDWRLAFSRPGFVSFKCSENIGAVLAARMPVFARTLSVSLGKLDDATLPRAADRFWQLDGLAAVVQSQQTIAVHVWQRDTLLPGQDDYEPCISATAIEARQAILEAAAGVEWLQPESLIRGPVAPANSVVLDVVLVEPDQWVVGWHRAAARQQRWPGGMLPVAAPDGMVSRAFLKMEEALKWSALPTSRGELWVELGCAPGGASQALLERGFRVLGIDPAEVDPRVANHADFTHLRKRVSEVRRLEFAPAKWLAADLNVAPQYTLDAVESVVAHPANSLRGIVLTLKLADWQVASPDRLTEYVQRVKSWAFRDVRLRQLVHNRQEICLVALHSRAQRRMKRSRRRTNHHAANEETIAEAGNPDEAEVRFDGPTRMTPPHHFR